VHVVTDRLALPIANCQLMIQASDSNLFTNDLRGGYSLVHESWRIEE
jgi:hypothetical protein